MTTAREERGANSRAGTACGRGRRAYGLSLATPRGRSILPERGVSSFKLPSELGVSTKRSGV